MKKKRKNHKQKASTPPLPRGLKKLTFFDKKCEKKSYSIWAQNKKKTLDPKGRTPPFIQASYLFFLIFSKTTNSGKVFGKLWILFSEIHVH